MVWARWRDTTQFKKVKTQSSADTPGSTYKGDLVSLEFFDGTHGEADGSALIYASPQFKHGVILMVKGDMTRQYGIISDSYLEMALDDMTLMPYWTYVVDWGKWTVGDDNYQLEHWTGDKVSSTDHPRQKYLVGQLVDVQDWKTVIRSVRVMEYMYWDEDHKEWWLKLMFPQGPGGGGETSIYNPEDWPTAARDRPNDVVIDHWAKGNVETSVTTAGVDCRGARWNWPASDR